MQRHFRHSSKLQLEMAFDVEVRDHVGVRHSFEAMGHAPFGSVKRQSLERVQEVLVNIRNYLLRLTDTQVALAGADHEVRPAAPHLNLRLESPLPSGAGECDAQPVPLRSGRLPYGGAERGHSLGEHLPEALLQVGLGTRQRGLVRGQRPAHRI